MKRPQLILYLGIIFLTGLVFVMDYVFNLKRRIEREQNIILSPSARNFEVDSKWWIPPDMNLAQHTSAVFVIHASSLDSLLVQFKKKHLEDSSLIYKRYVAPDHIDGGETTINIALLENQSARVRIGTDYN